MGYLIIKVNNFHIYVLNYVFVFHTLAQNLDYADI